jgi:hypothetical protein
VGKGGALIDPLSAVEEGRFPFGIGGGEAIVGFSTVEDGRLEVDTGGGENLGAFSEREDARLEINEEGREPPGTDGGRARGGRAVPTTGDFTLSEVVETPLDDLDGGGGGVSSLISFTKLEGNTPISPRSFLPFHQPSSASRSKMTTYSPFIKLSSSSWSGS